MITDAFSHNTATFKWIDYTWRKCQNVFCSRFTLKNIYWSQIPSMINGFQLLTRKWKIVNNLLHKCLALQCAVGEISDLHESGSDIFYLTCDVIWWLYNNWKNSNIELFNRSICIFEILDDANIRIPLYFSLIFYLFFIGCNFSISH